MKTAFYLLLIAGVLLVASKVVGAFAKEKDSKEDVKTELPKNEKTTPKKDKK